LELFVVCAGIMLHFVPSQAPFSSINRAKFWANLYDEWKRTQM